MVTSWLVQAMLITSSGMSESPLSFGARAEARAWRIEASAKFESTNKDESGAGWVGRGEALVRTGLFLNGLQYRYRDGGPWVKQSLLLSSGLGWRGTRLLVRVPVWNNAAAQVNPSVASFEASARLGRAEFVLGRAYWLNTYYGDSLGHGWYSEVRMGYGRGRR